MPLPGGPSDKYGNRFEGKWTAYCIAQVMAENADCIRLEPLGTEGEGAEFTLHQMGSVEYHQVKRQHSRDGGWSIAQLSSNGVLRHSFLKTSGPNDRYIFVSTISAGLLTTLTDDARRTETLTDFKEFFLKGDKAKTWAKICEEWHDLIQQEIASDIVLSSEDLESAHERTAYEHIKRIRFRTFDEDSLTEMVETVLRTIVRSDPSTVRHALCDIALESIHATLYPDELWKYVENLGCRRVDFARDDSVLTAVEELNTRYASMIKGVGDGIMIPREEVFSVMKILKSEEGKTSALVSGEAGVGKTSVLGQSIRQLKNENIPHLYFRVDRLEPTDLPTNVSEQLGLPSTPAEVLAGIAHGRPCVLIIDQLDAVSFVSGRNPDFFDCVHEIIRQASAFPNMHLLLACRRFDIEKDNRLRELVSEDGLAQEINVKLLTPENVHTVLEQLGCPPSNYKSRQIELLRLPLHLALFSTVMLMPRDAPFHFATSIDIFEAYWDLKRRAVMSRAGLVEDHWIPVLDRLCKKMTERQTLFAPEACVLDDYERTVRAMESENVLLLDRGRVGFFHEGFFDYVFARRFTAQGKDLILYLKDEEQGLFKRAPLRQILLHTHALEHIEFVRELRRVVLDPSIRFHLRRCALEVSTRIECATPELWQLFKEIFSSEDPALIREVWRVIWMVPSWFEFLNEQGYISSWIASNVPDERNGAIIMIRNNIQIHPGECVDLLYPYVGISDHWNTEILKTIEYRALATDRRIFELFLSINATSTVTSTHHHNFWMRIYELPKTQPDWAAEALGQYLRITTSSIPADTKGHFLPHDIAGERLVLDIAENSPSAFLDQVLPVFIDVVQRTSIIQGEGLKLDRVWSARSYREDPLSIEAALLISITRAFKALSRTSIPDFTRHLNSLFSHGEFDSINFVLVRSLAAAPPEFSDISINYLINDPRRMECGWPCAGGGDFKYWAARELIAHATLNCSQESFTLLEAIMINYFPRWETSVKGFRERGYWQLILLDALPSDRRSGKTNVRLEEWYRKFRGVSIIPPVASEFSYIGSPIKEDAASRMKDSHWLRALEDYDKEESSRRRRRAFIEGGAHQLSGLLESETERDPVRFAQLSEHFPPNTHCYYYHALLRGLRKSDVDKNITLQVVRRVFELPSQPGQRYLCDAIAKFSNTTLPEDILTIVGWCATESKDPDSNELTIRTMGKEEENLASNMLDTSINSVRGAAAMTVGNLIFDNAKRVSFFMPYLEKMAQDSTVIVRTTVAYSLLCLYKHNECRAVDLFLLLVDVDNDHLLATHHVDRFLYHANARHFRRLRPILIRMINSSISSVREAGARHACLALFSNKDAANMVAECVKGDGAQRIGVARVAKANLFNSNFTEFTHEKLPTFFNDSLKDIRDEAASCFRQAKGRDLDTAKSVIRAFIQSEAFGESLGELIWALEHSTADIAEETLLTCEAAIAHMESLQNARTQHVYGQPDNIAELVLRAYRQTENPATRIRCLNIIDRLLAQEVYGISKELEDFER